MTESESRTGLQVRTRGTRQLCHRPSMALRRTLLHFQGTWVSENLTRDVLASGPAAGLPPRRRPLTSRSVECKWSQPRGLPRSCELSHTVCPVFIQMLDFKVTLTQAPSL